MLIEATGEVALTQAKIGRDMHGKNAGHILDLKINRYSVPSLEMRIALISLARRLDQFNRNAVFVSEVFIMYVSFADIPNLLAC